MEWNVQHLCHLVEVILHPFDNPQYNLTNLLLLVPEPLHLYNDVRWDRPSTQQEEEININNWGEKKIEQQRK